MQIHRLNERQLLAQLDDFATLLTDAVGHGASMGFMLPLAQGEAEEYWRGVATEIAAGCKVLLAAVEDGGALLGSGQLALAMRANGRHRAEVQKLMVRRASRGRGIGAALMGALEAEARSAGRTLLHLDTSVGRSGAVEFYLRLGYVQCGSIPDWARDPDGPLAANAIFYKRV